MTEKQTDVLTKLHTYISIYNSAKIRNYVKIRKMIKTYFMGIKCFRKSNRKAKPTIFRTTSSFVSTPLPNLIHKKKNI